MTQKMLLLSIVAITMFGRAVSAPASDRHPSALVPDSALYYGELNLDELQERIPLRSLASATSDFRDALRAWPVLTSLQAGDADFDRAAHFIAMAKPMLMLLLRAAGPRIAWAILPDASSGGSDLHLMIVMEARDLNALDAAVVAALTKNEVTVAPLGLAETSPGMRQAYAVGKHDGAILESGDWLVYADSKALAKDLAAMVTGRGQGSLWALPAYRQAIAGLPRDAVLLQYMGNWPFKAVADSLKQTPYPPSAVGVDPGFPIAWATDLRLTTLDGRPLLIAQSAVGVSMLGHLANLAIAGFIPDAVRQRNQRQTSECLDHIGALGQAMKQYASEHAGVFPDAGAWVDQIHPYLKDASALKCPLDMSPARTSFAMNQALGGKQLPAGMDPARVVLLYETGSPDNNPAGDGRDAATPPRHDGQNAYAYADGHTTLLSGTPPPLFPVETVPANTNAPNEPAPTSPAGKTEIWRGGAFSLPSSVAVNPTDGSSWVADYANSQIVHLSGNGVELFRSAKVFRLNVAQSISVNPRDGSCWVADTGHDQVVHLSARGAELFRGGDSPSLFRSPQTPLTAPAG